MKIHDKWRFNNDNKADKLELSWVKFNPSFDLIMICCIKLLRKNNTSKFDCRLKTTYQLDIRIKKIQLLSTTPSHATIPKHP